MFMATSLLWAGIISPVHARRSPPSLVLAGMGRPGGRKQPGGFGYLVALSVVGGSSYAWLLQHVNPVAISTHAFVDPVVAAVLVLGDQLQAEVFMAAASLVPRRC